MPENLFGAELMSQRYGTGFLEDHAREIVRDPATAVCELICNAYDAGATVVRIDWPNAPGAEIRVTDNGHGLTPTEFGARWRTISYRRREEQPGLVRFPADVIDPPERSPFGKNGKGRWAPFCFSDEYFVESRTESGTAFTARIGPSTSNDRAFDGEFIAEDTSLGGHGTCVRFMADRALLPRNVLMEELAARFSAADRFEIRVGDRLVRIEHLRDANVLNVDLPDGGTVEVLWVAGPSASRTTKLTGISWWVGRRRVGAPSWNSPTERLLDGRLSEAKRFVFLARVDCLEPFVESDWSGFRRVPEADEVLDAVCREVAALLDRDLIQRAESRKRRAIDKNAVFVQALAPSGQRAAEELATSLAQRLPRLSDEQLRVAVEVFAIVEEGREGLDLLRQLAVLPRDDLRAWNEVVSKWSAQQARLVLDEVAQRLALIRELERRGPDIHSLELSVIQPIFEAGLWMLGHAYDGHGFYANKEITTIAREEIERTVDDRDRKRPDIVVFGFEREHSEDGEPAGKKNGLVIELKRGGSHVGIDADQQAQRYLEALVNKKVLQASGATHVAFVIGHTKDSRDPTKFHPGGATAYVRLRTFGDIIVDAKRRTFRLYTRLRRTTPGADEFDAFLRQFSD